MQYMSHVWTWTEGPENVQTELRMLASSLRLWPFALNLEVWSEMVQSRHLASPIPASLMQYMSHVWTWTEGRRNVQTELRMLNQSL